MTVSCFLCENNFTLDKQQKNTLNELLKFSCFKNFNQHTQTYHLCNECCGKNNSFLKIYDFLEFTNHDLTNVNLFMSNNDIYISKQSISSILKKSEKKKKQNDRKVELLNVIKKLRLDYNKIICDSYIKFGKETLQEVVLKLTQLQTDKNERLFDLLNELGKYEMEYDSKIPSFKKFVAKGGDIKKTIDKAKLEKVLADNTDYLDLLNNKVDSETAIELSISKFPNNVENHLVDNYMKNKNRIIF